MTTDDVHLMLIHLAAPASAVRLRLAAETLEQIEEITVGHDQLRIPSKAIGSVATALRELAAAQDTQLRRGPTPEGG